LKQIHRSPGKKFEKKFMSSVNSSGKEQRVFTFKKLMCNYFSFGIDSRIGYGRFILVSKLIVLKALIKEEPNQD